MILLEFFISFIVKVASTIAIFHIFLLHRQNCTDLSFNYFLRTRLFYQILTLKYPGVFLSHCYSDSIQLQCKREGVHENIALCIPAS